MPLTRPYTLAECNVSICTEQSNGNQINHIDLKIFLLAITTKGKMKLRHDIKKENLEFQIEINI